MLQLFIALVIILFLGLFIMLSVPMTDDEESSSMSSATDTRPPAR
jgi:hypothetical protein